MNDTLSSLKLTLLHTGYAKLNDTWGFKNVISPFVRLFLITKGEAWAFYQGKPFLLKPSYMYLIPSFTYNDYSCDNYHEQYYVGFFEEIKFGMSLFNQVSVKYQVKANVADYDLFKRLAALNPEKKVLDHSPKSHINKGLLTYQRSKQNKLSGAIETESLIAILLSRFIEHESLRSDSKLINGNLNNIMSYIGKNLDKDITVHKMASFCNLSADYFSRTFYEMYNLHPSKYLLIKRIERAQFLLLTTNQTLKQVSENVGLQSLSYFSKKFKEHVGLSPAKFRKEQLNL